jgi:hypothetical protein
MTGDEPVALGPPQRLGQHLVSDALEAVVEVLVAVTTMGKLGEHRQRPSAIK